MVSQFTELLSQTPSLSPTCSSTTSTRHIWITLKGPTTATFKSKFMNIASSMLDVNGRENYTVEF